jgi:16S rRNA (adenine1518-N6/adenine1519-N6)-dimethyltransferase
MIKEAELTSSDTVVEIGAGAGFLTKELLKKCKVTAVELDPILFELLQKELPQKDLKLIQGDFLKVDLGEFNKLVALPPYTISSEIMYRLFELKPELCVMVFQRAFVERLMSEPGFMDYNALPVLTQYNFEVEMLYRVPPKSFFPQPKSDSSMIRLKAVQRFGTAKNESAFKQFVKSIFRFQNKNMLNAVKNCAQFMGSDFDKELALEVVKSSEFAETKVNLLSCKDFVDVFNKMS